MIVRKILFFVILLGSLGQASADLEAVIDLADGQESMFLGKGAIACKQRCFGVHRIEGGYVLLVLRDDDGRASFQVLPWLDGGEKYDLTLDASSSESGQDSSGQKRTLVGHGGNCEDKKVNCIEFFVVPSGYVVIVEYGLQGKIKSHKVVPVQK